MQHLAEKGIYTFQAVWDQDIIRVQLLTRHDSKLKYNTYIRYNPEKDGRDAILDWYCQCKKWIKDFGLLYSRGKHNILLFLC